jgi:ppGpp synthetase/RelA/SpoT-type nucleotidyltranferase
MQTVIQLHNRHFDSTTAKHLCLHECSVYGFDMGAQTQQKHVRRLVRIHRRNLPRYKRMRTRAEGLVRSILPMQFVHSVQSRVKKPKSLANKIVDKKYSSFDQITDIVGVRVITNFSDDANRIAERIREEFSIDEKNSIDKSKLLDPDQFGYLSLQLIARIGNKSERRSKTAFAGRNSSKWANGRAPLSNN